MLFLPNEIIIAGITGLACAYRAGAVYLAADPYLDRLRLSGPGCSHHQLALRPDRSAERVACGALIPRPTLPDGQRPRSAVRTLAHLRFPRRELLVDPRRSDQPVGPVECRSGGRERRRLATPGRPRGGE